MSIVRNTARRAYRELRRQRNERAYRQMASGPYENIVRFWPDKAPSTAQKKIIREYCRDQLGDTQYAAWLEVFAAWRGEFVEGCLPHNYIENFVAPHTTGGYRGLLTSTTSRRVLDTDRLPDIAYVFVGKLYDLDLVEVDVQDFAAKTFADHECLYIKEATGMMGLGVIRAHQDKFAEIVAQAKSAVVQYPISMHPELVERSPNAAATLRITTVLDDGAARAVGAHLRLGRTDEEVITSADSLRACVDLSTGKLCEYGSHGDWTPTTVHPDTNIPFAGYEVPGFANAVETCCSLHERLRHVLLLGWDVAITSDTDAMLFEVNSWHPGIAVQEAEYGPVFAGLGWDKLHLGS